MGLRSIFETRPYLAALAVYASSRMLILVALDFAERYVPLNSSPGVWSVGKFPLSGLIRWDSGWYLGIATDGYSYNGDPSIQQNINFYPLYPLLSRITATLLHIEVYQAMVVVAHLASVAEIMLLAKLVRPEPAA